MFKPKLPLRVFAAAIAQSVSHANEMLEQDYHLAVECYRNDQFQEVVPPPPPLMIQNVKVKFSGNVSKTDRAGKMGELNIDLSKPQGNFSAELEFAPFTEEMLRSGQSEKPEGEYRQEDFAPDVTTETVPELQRMVPAQQTQAPQMYDCEV